MNNFNTGSGIEKRERLVDTFIEYPESDNHNSRMSSTTSKDSQNLDETSAFYANNDASSYNARYLKSIRNKERFQELHFFQCDEELIDELIPKKAGKGTLFPPSIYRASAANLYQWRDLDEAEQLRIIEQEKLKQGQQAAVPAAAPASVTVSSTSPVSASTNGDLKRSSGTASVEATAPAPASKVARMELQQQPPRPQNYPPIPVRWKMNSMDINIDFRKDRICRGITLPLLKRLYQNETEKLKGFGILVGEAMKQKVEVYTKNLSWPFACDPRLVGCLVNKEGADEVVLTWMCVQLPENKDGEPITNESKFDGIHFYHPTCDRSSTSLLCENCKGHVNEFVTLCGAFQRFM